MKIVKIVPKSKRAKNRVHEHGEAMELVLDQEDKFMVRSLNESFKHSESLMGKWLGWFDKEEADWEEVC